MEVVTWIQEQITQKKILPGQKLYSENELKEMFQVSRQTVRHAISVLEAEGTVNRIRGSGTYLSNKRQINLEKRTRICVVTTYVDSYIFPRTIKGIEDVLFRSGYSVQIAFTNNQNSREKMILEDILNRDEVAGVIMETTKSGIPNPNLALYERMIKRGIPILFVNSYYPQLSIPHVSLDDVMTGKTNTEYLIKEGHRKIGGIFKLDDGQGPCRYRGYVEAMEEAGLEVNDNNIVWIDTVDCKQLDKSREKLMDRLSECTAVVCYNDEIAYGFIELLKKEGLRVPADISIVSVDDSELAVLSETAITSIAHPMEKLGEKAAENLIEMILSPSYNGTFEFEARLVCRDSVRTLFHKE